jgi:hypothetical protein
MIELDQLDEKLAGGGSGPTICYVSPPARITVPVAFLSVHRALPLRSLFRGPTMTAEQLWERREQKPKYRTSENRDPAQG